MYILVLSTIHLQGHITFADFAAGLVDVLETGFLTTSSSSSLSSLLILTTFFASGFFVNLEQEEYHSCTLHKYTWCRYSYMTSPNAKCQAEKKKLQQESQVTTIMGTDAIGIQWIGKTVKPTNSNPGSMRCQPLQSALGTSLAVQKKLVDAIKAYPLGEQTTKDANVITHCVTSNFNQNMYSMTLRSYDYFMEM